MGKSAKFLRAGKTKVSVRRYLRRVIQRSGLKIEQKDLNRIKTYSKTRRSAINTSKVRPSARSIKTDPVDNGGIAEIVPAIGSKKRSRPQDDEFSDLMDLDDFNQAKKPCKVYPDQKKSKLTDTGIDYITLMGSRLTSRSLKRELELHSAKELLKNAR